LHPLLSRHSPYDRAGRFRCENSCFPFRCSKLVITALPLVKSASRYRPGMTPLPELLLFFLTRERHRSFFRYSNLPLSRSYGVAMPVHPSRTYLSQTPLLAGRTIVDLSVLSISLCPPPVRDSPPCWQNSVPKDRFSPFSLFSSVSLDSLFHSGKRASTPFSRLALRFDRARHRSPVVTFFLNLLIHILFRAWAVFSLEYPPPFGRRCSPLTEFFPFLLGDPRPG